MNGAFQNCAGITSVTIPNTITIIGKYAFENCTGLKSITIPDSVTKIEDSAFRGCSGITSITFSANLTTIEDDAFKECTSLKKVIIPDAVTSIGSSAFWMCSSLKELSLSKNLSVIPRDCFYGCTGLTSVILPDSVTTISNFAFYGGSSEEGKLTKILIPDSVDSIADNAFNYQSKLTIYGNDGMTSKEFAKEHGFKFANISQWNEVDVGTDLTPPYVKNIRASVEGYYDSNSTKYKEVPLGKTISIDVYFNENIFATEVPSLTIKFGNGSNIVLTEGTVSDTRIIYNYTVAKNDDGIISAVSLTGGTVTDEAGYEAVLSCPELEFWNKSIYAKGSVTDANDENNNGASNGEETTKEDTGLSQEVIDLVIIAVIVIGAVVYFRYNKKKETKQ